MKQKWMVMVAAMGMLLLTSQTMAQQNANGVGIAQAETIITQTYPGVVINSIQRVQHHGVLVWEARLLDGMTIYVDAQTGEIVGRVQAPSPSVTNPPTPRINPPNPLLNPPNPSVTPATRPAVATGRLSTVVGLPAVDFVQALSLAEAQYPGTLLIKAELEPQEHTRGTGPLTWDMKMSNGMAVYVDAETGAIVELEPWGGRRGPSGTPVGNISVNLAEALNTAQGYYPEWGFSEIVLEYGGRLEGYALVWKVKFGRGQEVAIDATNGTVVRIR